MAVDPTLALRVQGSSPLAQGLAGGLGGFRQGRADEMKRQQFEQQQRAAGQQEELRGLQIGQAKEQMGQQSRIQQMKEGGLLANQILRAEDPVAMKAQLLASMPEGRNRDVLMALPDDPELLRDAAQGHLTELSENISILATGSRPAQKEKKTFKLGEGEKLYDSQGNIVAENLKAFEDQLDQKELGDLRKEATAMSKDFRKVDSAWRKVQSSGLEPSAAGDMALIFNYMKMLDPGSTVREGEFRTASEAGGWDDRIEGFRQQIISGKRLTADQRADFLDQAEGLFNAEKGSFDLASGAIRRNAESRNFPLDQIFFDEVAGDGAPVQQPIEQMGESDIDAEIALLEGK